MAYATTSNVAKLCLNLADGWIDFTTETKPAISDVQTWLSSGCSIIETKLSSWGYSTPVPTTSALYDYIRDLNTFYAAARAEMSRMTATTMPGERTRGQVFDRMFWDNLHRLEEMHLSGGLVGAGLTVSSTAGEIYVGGISETDKEVYSDNTDYVEPRFKRDKHKIGGTLL